MAVDDVGITVERIVADRPDLVRIGRIDGIIGEIAGVDDLHPDLAALLREADGDTAVLERGGGDTVDAGACRYGKGRTKSCAGRVEMGRHKLPHFVVVIDDEKTTVLQADDHRIAV